MKKILFMLVFGFLFLSACAPKDGHIPGKDIEAHDAWARSAIKDGNGAAYMLLHNHTLEDDALVGVSSDAAKTVEIHLSQIKADGTMEMIPQESIGLPVDAEVELKPGSYHVMLIGLTRDLKAGDEISLTLHFKSHEDITLKVPVMDTEGMGGSGMDMQ